MTNVKNTEQLFLEKMKVRNSKEYAYKNLLEEIRKIYYQENYIDNITFLERGISRVKNPSEKVWLQELLDFQICARNLGYCAIP